MSRSTTIGWMSSMLNKAGPLSILGFQPRPSVVLFNLSQDTYQAAFDDFRRQREEELKSSYLATSLRRLRTTSIGSRTGTRMIFSDSIYFVILGNLSLTSCMLLLLRNVEP
jgi:hypothetical protein